jgi:hypothetical protein
MPDWTQHVRPRLSGLRLSPTREAEIVEELSQHLDDRWRELIASGMTPAEATQVALADFRDDNLLADYIAPLRQAHSPSAITPGESESEHSHSRMVSKPTRRIGITYVCSCVLLDLLLASLANFTKARCLHRRSRCFHVK